MILSLTFLSLAVACHSISQLAQHGKLKFKGAFWHQESWLNKYDWPAPAPNNWYYKIIGAKYKENWFTSTWLTVALTDGYHFMQFMFFNFLSLSITFALGFQWLTLGLVWALIHVIHFLVYRLLSK